MAYVSELLTHFVGRSLPTEEDRFSLLLKILREGRLGQWREEGNVRIDPASISISGLGSLCENSFVDFAPVCFCDIPETDLDRHTNLYGCFGIAFTKTFLSELGANPVFYVAKGSLATHRQPPLTGALFEQLTTSKPLPPGAFYGDLRAKPVPIPRCKFFDELAGEVLTVLPAPWPPGTPPDASDPYRELQARVKFDLLRHVFAFMKFFDETLPEEDADNYYMEREWRVAGFVRFTVANVARIYVPKGYGSRLLAEIPSVHMRELPI
ncbi:MAG TPA: abortive infection system antitoxin AbiGi family protein [Fimbriimonadaceae bacterium]|nr:abortive infection system antitoxin AbiGi family protein [Fimbriimonadaceae bacterium]